MQAQERDKLINDLRATIAYAEQLKNETEEELKKILGNYYDEIMLTPNTILNGDHKNKISGSISLQN